MSSTTTHTTPSPTSTGSHGTGTGTGGANGNGDGNGNGTSRPLLFFVALGFGVVFTNLWIIVGVKYCFRYNQRARQGQIDHETGEPIDMNNLPRPRRRREKKLMTMEEVNERFPLTKYKTWRAARVQEGLPAAAGVTAPPSRAASIKDTMVDRTSTDAHTRASEDVSSTNAASSASSAVPGSDAHDFAKSQTSSQTTPENPIVPGTIKPTVADQEPATGGPAAVEVDDDDDDPIRTAVPAELLQNPGDACAICIDNIEDDEEVRGLTCGHAFHAGCVDPWLTSRRACCPLCKADYYIPKPRPEGEDASAEGPVRRPAVPANVWIGHPSGSFRPRMLFATSLIPENDPNRPPGPGVSLWRRARPQPSAITDPSAQQESTPADTDASPSQSNGSSFTQRLRSIPAAFRPSRSAGQNTTDSSAQDSAAQTTPSQLESGAR